MGQQEPRQTREGRLIDEAAKATGRSARQLAANAGISDTRWRQIVKGWQPGPGGGHIQVIAPAMTLAKMALVVGLSPEKIAKTGRTDAAELMARSDSGIDVMAFSGDTVQVFQAKWHHNSDEIDLIYASKTMSAREKLDRIRMVLELRAQAEAESGQQEAPAPSDAGASVEQS